MSEESDEKKGKTDKKSEELDLSNPNNLFDLIYESENAYVTKSKIIEHLQKVFDKSKLKNKYNLLFLFDEEGRINNYISNKIYSALSEKGNKEKDILLILYSKGGLVEPAYLISKCCKEYAKEKFIAAIPRQAKSAATLLAVGANEIHMGLMSELGPIDPQIGNYPAQGLGHAVEYLANLCKKYPESSNMFAKYLSLSLDLRYFGYLERVSESAVQYAERLLKDKKLATGQTSNSVATRLVYSYKDHSFVIDKDEAETFLGTDLIKFNTEEYKLSDEFYKFLNWATIAYKVFKKVDFSIVGDIATGISLIEPNSE